MEGKKEFYKKVEEALKSKGYDYYDGDRDVPGKGRQHANKPDFIAVKGSMVFIGEIKSPAEGPKSGSWRQIQNSDTEQFKAVRMDVVKREKAGLVLPEIGGHEIIICGQVADYVRKIGINYNLPASIPKNAEIMMAYSMTEAEADNVEKALANCKKKVHEKIDTGNGSITYLFSFEIAGRKLNPLPICYCILENYKGKKKVFLGNTHLYLIPIPEGRYLYLGMLGNYVGSDNCYSCRLIVNMEGNLITRVLAGEGEELGERFQVIETLNCQPNPAEEGGYFIELLEKGKYIQSDLIIRLNDKHKNKSEDKYIIAGHLSFLSEPVLLKENNKEI